MRGMSAKEPLRSADVFLVECGSCHVCFLSSDLLYLLLTFKNDVLNNKTAILNS